MGGLEALKPEFVVGDRVRVYKNGKLPTHRGKITGVGQGLQTFTYVVDGEICYADQLAKDITHLSPTGLSLFEQNREEFYVKYLSRKRAEKIPQTVPMAVGSSFDAYVKSFLMDRLCTKKVSFEELFEKQVEPQNRATAVQDGKYCFDAYKASGALADLMLELVNGEVEPEFEFAVTGVIKRDDLEVPVTGRPDLYFKNTLGARIVGDWKVNGFYSNSAQSPKKGYVMCRDGWVGNQSRNNKSSHKDAWVIKTKGISVNSACHLEDIEVTWATQVCTYAWLLGEPVGSDFICGIEQLCCSPGEGRPKIRVASFRNKITSNFQTRVFDRYKECWKACQGHFFAELSREESDKRCAQLEDVAASFQTTGDEREDWFTNAARRS